MSAFAPAINNKVLDHLTKVATWTAPTNLYAALLNVVPGPTGPAPGDEVDSGVAPEYVRQNVTGLFSPAANAETHNTAKVTYPAVGATAWGTVVAVALYDALTNGNVIAFGALDVPIGTGTDDVLVFNVGALSLGLV